jgi:Ca2+-binding EF-hand superfamily protein
MDTNRDRTLQFEEISAARAKLFDRIDANHDGIADPGEFRNAATARKSNRDAQLAQADDLAARRQRMDTNRDGNISRDEFVAFIPDRLLNADSDGNRSLSLTELRTLRRK